MRAVLFFALLPVATFLFYALTMKLIGFSQQPGKARWIYLAYPFALVGYVLDVALNVTWGTVVFLDLPRELTLTHRLRRYVAGEGWRKWLAKQIALILDPLDPSGKHV